MKVYILSHVHRHDIVEQQKLLVRIEIEKLFNFSIDSCLLATAFGVVFRVQGQLLLHPVRVRVQVVDLSRINPRGVLQD